MLHASGHGLIPQELWPPIPPPVLAHHERGDRALRRAPIDAADDPDVYPFDETAAMLDLRPAIRETWLLSVPGFALCRDECKGLCPNCGTDWNNGTCDCAPATSESRWDALRAIRDKLP